MNHADTISFAKFGSGMTGRRCDSHRSVVSGDAAEIERVENYDKDGRQVGLPYGSRPPQAAAGG